MAQYMERMLSLLQAPEEGKEGAPVLSDGGKFKHYRRKKTNKAPRKRTFVMNMTRAPTILTDALASSARGTGKGVGGTPPPPSLANPGPSAGSTPAPAADEAQQQQIADAGLRNLPVMYPPVVLGTKSVPTAPTPLAAPSAAAAPGQPSYYWDPELAAALAEYQPTPAPATILPASTFRAVTTTLDQLPPSTMARSICTGLEPLGDVPAKKTTTTTSASAAPTVSGMASRMPAQRASSMGMMSHASSMAAPGPLHQAWSMPVAMQMHNSVVSGPSFHMSMASSISLPPPQQQLQVQVQAPQQLLMGSTLSSSELGHRSQSDHSTRSSNTQIRSADDAFPMIAGVPAPAAMPQAGFPGAGASRFGGASDLQLQQQQQAPAVAVTHQMASQPLLVLPLDPAGWSKLPPRAQVAANAWGAVAANAGAEDETGLYNPNRVACHTLLDVGAYGAVYRGSLQSDEEGVDATMQVLKPSLFAEVAVKLMRPGQWAQAPAKVQEQVLRSFQVEAELLPSLSHPNVVPVWYVNADPAMGAVCLVQELASLGTLADYIHGRPRSGSSATAQTAALLHRQQVEAAVLARLAAQMRVPTQVLVQRLGGEGPGLAAERRKRVVLLCLLRDIAAALAYLAALPQPIVHRDVKPANVLISSQGKALLADFGVAKLTPSAMQRQASSAAWGSDGAVLPPAKRSRTMTSSDVAAASPQQSAWHSAPVSPAASPAAAGSWSPAPSSEDTDWMDALLSEDLELPLAAAQALATNPVVDADSLGWLHDLLGQDDAAQPRADPGPAPAPASAASPAMSASAGSAGAGSQGQQWGEGFGAWASGDAASMEQQSSALDHDLQGTAHYAAPEDLMGPAASPYALGPAADVFSLGYCIWEALSAQRPWAGMRAAALANSVGAKGARLPVNRGWSLQLQGLLRRAWQADPSSRPVAVEVAAVLEAELLSIVGSV